MTARDFIIDSKKFNRRKLTELQHKIRTVLKCYTATEFTLNENDNTFTFKKSYRIKGIRIDDPKTHSGTYTIEDLGDGNYKLRIIIL
jgi:hypothetical protein